MLIGTGIALVAVAVWCILQARMARHSSAFLAGARLLTCAEVTDAGPGQVAVVAATGTEPRLCAPITGRNCVWYRVAISLQMGEEGLGPVKRRHETAAGGIYLEDATGTLPLTRDLARRTLTQWGDSPIITTTGFPNSSAARSYVKKLWWNGMIGPQHRLAGPDQAKFTYQLTEAILPPAVPVLVVGTIVTGDTGGHVLDRASRRDGATTLSQREAVGYHATRARRWWISALCLVATGVAAAITGFLLSS